MYVCINKYKLLYLLISYISINFHLAMQNIRMNRESVFKTIRNPIKMPSSINVDLKTIEKYQKSGN